MRRLTLGGDEMVDIGEGVNVKLMVPPAGLSDPEWPMVGPDGRPAWPAPDKRPVVRTYSVRRYDPSAGELDIDFLLHDGGVASEWAARAKPGDLLGVGKPGGLTIREADWYLFAGDESTLPAISRVLEQLPPSAQGHALIEVGDESDEQTIQTRSEVRVTWLHRHRAAPGTTTLLQDAVHATPWPTHERVFAWIGGESSAVRAIRVYVRDERGLDFRRFLAVGYWKRGMSETDYKQAHDNDRGEDYHRASEELSRDVRSSI